MTRQTDRREIVDALEERQQDIAARGGERFATGVRLAQVEGAAAQGADRRQGIDQVAKSPPWRNVFKSPMSYPEKVPACNESADASVTA